MHQIDSYSNQSDTSQIPYWDMFIEILRQLQNRPKNSVQELMIIAIALRMQNAFKAAKVLIENNLDYEAYSSLRSALEAIILIAGAWKYPSFKEYKTRLHVHFLFDKIEINNRYKHLQQRTNSEIAEINSRIKVIENELKNLYQNGYFAFGAMAIEPIAKSVRLSKLKYDYYRMLSIDTHACLHSIERYIAYDELKNEASFFDIPKDGAPSSAIETLSYFMFISSCFLNTIFELHYKLPDGNEFFSDFEQPRSKLRDELEKIKKKYMAR